MSPTLAFILGLLIGWLVEWIIDWVYWRRRWQGAGDRCREEKAALQAEIDSLKQQLAGRSGPAVEAMPAAEPVVSDVRAVELPLAAEPAALQPDDLIIIKGIGPVINRLLNQNGIYTFEQLAAENPEHLRAMLGDAINRLADEASIIEQARQFAERKQGRGV